MGDQCVNKGIYAEENEEFLRGEDVLRIHVKTWEALDLIQDVLEEVELMVPVARIALPYSMKNKFQKKGFICYLKVASEEDVPTVQKIFGQDTEAFKKCEVALPSEKSKLKAAQKQAEAMRKAEEVSIEQFVTRTKKEAGQTSDFSPPIMASKRSLTT